MAEFFVRIRDVDKEISIIADRYTQGGWVVFYDEIENNNNVEWDILAEFNSDYIISITKVSNEPYPPR